MEKIVNLYKSVGMTPLQAINRFRERSPFYKKKKMSYAGRLDPMAEGVLLVLVGEETKKIRQYLGFDKEYRAEILIGISSDSNDILGIASIDKFEDKERGIKQASENQSFKTENLSDINTEIDNKSLNNIGGCETRKNIQSYQSFQLLEDTKNNEIIKGLINKLKKRIKKLKGRYEQKIPNYSSYRIKGKPMFYYARKGEIIEEIKKVVYIKSIKINSIYRLSSQKLLKYAVNKIDLIVGDFRQEKIKEKWKELLENSDEKFLVVDITINCSSGTYIRAIAEDIGKSFGGGLLLSLKRTSVGKFNIGESLRF